MVKPPWPAERIAEMKIAYLEEYRRWSNTTHGPSLIGTKADLYRLQMLIMDSYAEKYADVDWYYKEIMTELDKVVL